MKTVPKRFREWLSFKLVLLAQRIYPESEAVKAFYLQCYYDMVIYGTAVFGVDPASLYQKEKE